MKDQAIVKFSLIIFLVLCCSQLMAEEKINLAEIRDKLDLPKGSFLVFDSKRDNNFGIYKLDLDTGETKKVVSTPQQELYPDISPDGSKVVFARHKTQERDITGKVIMVNIDGSNPKVIADKATFPTFSSDGKAIIFEKNRKRVMRYNLETSEIERLFPDKKQARKFKTIVKPRLSASGKWLSFTSDRPARWANWYVNLETNEAFHGPAGCEAVTNATDDAIYYVMPGTQGAKAGSGIYRYDFATKQKTAVEDQAGPWGHEYFPSFTSNDEYMAFSACPENQHSAMDSNYQLYIKNLKTDLSFKVTEDLHNNRWAKLYIPKK